MIVSTVSVNSFSSTYSSCPPTPSDLNDQFTQQQQYQHQQLLFQQQQQQNQQYPTENNPTSFLNQSTYSPTSQSLPLSVYPSNHYLQQQQQQEQQFLQEQQFRAKSLVVESEASAFAAYALADIGRRSTEGVISIQNPGGMHQQIDA